MVTNPKGHLEFLDSLRGIAIILVFLYHIATPPSGFEMEISRPWVLIAHAAHANAGLVPRIETIGTIFFLYICTIGWCGVAIFFVVSGFCIHLAFCQSANGAVIGFYLRRFFRIYPPYLVALLIFATLFPGSRLPFTKLTHWAQLGTHILLFHNCSNLFCWAIDADYWTIAVEVQLYLLFPVVLLAVRRWHWGKTLFLLAVIEFSLYLICVLWDGRSPPAPAWLSRSPFIFWFSWSVGAAMADAYLKQRPLPFQNTSAALWLFAALVTSTSLIPNHGFSFSFFALFTATIVARKLSKFPYELRKPNVVGRLLRTTGRWSYSLYLIHHPILIAVAAAYRSRFPGLMEHPLLSFAAGLSSWAIIFPLSGLSYNLLERPSISVGKKILRGWANRTLVRHPEANTAANLS